MKAEVDYTNQKKEGVCVSFTDGKKHDVSHVSKFKILNQKGKTGLNDIIMNSNKKRFVVTHVMELVEPGLHEFLDLLIPTIMDRKEVAFQPVKDSCGSDLFTP